MSSLPVSDELFKAILTAIATALVARLSGVFEVLTDPNSPRRTLDDARQTLETMDAGAKVMMQLNQLPASPQRDQMQAKLDVVLKTVEQSQHQCSDETVQKRNKILKVLSLLRLNMPENFAKALLSFLFYFTLVLAIQSLHLYLTGVRLNPHLIWILSLISLVFWTVSGSKISPGTIEKPSESISKTPVPTL